MGGIFDLSPPLDVRGLNTNQTLRQDLHQQNTRKIFKHQLHKVSLKP